MLLLFALPWPASAQAAQAKPVRFKTDDGWTLAALYRAPKQGRAVAVLLHGVAAGKGEWGALTEELGRRGIGSLAVDLRGHGDSTQGPSGRTDFQGFDASGEWSKGVKDIGAAAAFLAARGIEESRIGYIGASIGANLVSAASPRPRWMVLLSPGMDYRGVRLAGPAKSLPVLVAASQEDAYAYRTAADYALQRGNVIFQRPSRGHGAQMLSDKEFLKRLLDWIEQKSR